MSQNEPVIQIVQYTNALEPQRGQCIPELGSREGLEAVTPSSTKESPQYPCLGLWRVKCWTERWPTRGMYAPGENRLCPLTRGLLVVKGRTVEGKDERVPQLPDRGKMRVNSFCTPNLEGVVVTDLSEESAFEAGRYAFAVWPRLAVVKWR